MNANGMPWPDRLGVGVAALVGVGLIGLISWISVGQTASEILKIWLELPGDLLKILAFTALPVWIVARVIDFILGGPQRRRSPQ